VSLIRADAINIPLQDGTVDLVVTSPPYFALRSYTDGGEHYDGQIGSEPTPQDFLEALWAVTAECARVLKPSGSIWVNLGDKYSGSDGASGAPSKQNAKTRDVRQRYRGDFGGIPAKSLMGLPWRYAIGCIDQLGLILRAEVIWSKPNGLPESVTDRVRRSHEQWFHLVKNGRYFAGIDEIREPQTTPATGGIGMTAESGNGIRHRTLNPNAYNNPLGKLPGSVWSIPSEPLKVPDSLGVDHFAAYPQEWPRRIILGWSPPGICTRCGDGRRPVVEKEYSSTGCTHNDNGGTTHRSADNGAKGTTEATITGYACQCPEPDAPTRPAVVLDPFSGTGTTVGVARTLGRYGVGLDLSADYLKLARWRIYESGHFAKTEARTNRERQGVLL